VEKKRKKYLTLSFSIIGIMLFLLCFFSPSRKDNPFPFSIKIPAYEALLSPKENDALLSYELQAKYLSEADLIHNYRTDFIATVVIAVDRDVVSESITGWRSLANGSYTVSFLSDSFAIGHPPPTETVNASKIEFLLLSMSYGIDYEPYQHNESFRLLRALHSENRLVIEKNISDAPVYVLLDYQAAQLQQKGHNFEIVVPEEGTLSFPFGVMTTKDISLPTVLPSDLLRAGFRLPDGQADASFYPPEEAYQNADFISDTQHFIEAESTVHASFRRSVLQEKRFTTVSGNEHLLSYIFTIAVLSLWGTTLLNRISEKKTQRYLIYIISLLVSWMILRIIKLIATDAIWVRYLWYGYYFFLLIIPVVLLLIGLELHGTKKKIPSWILFSISGLLFLFVITNDFHQLVFTFPYGTHVFEKYSYRFLYFIICAWGYGLLFFFTLFSCFKNKKNSLRAKIVPIVFFLACMIYTIGYVARIPLFAESEMSILFSLFSISFLEVCLRCTIIPNNRKHGELFQFASVDLQILTNRFRQEYSTKEAQPLPEEIFRRIQNTAIKSETPALFIPSYDVNVHYNVYKINGGYAVIRKNLDTIHDLRDMLSERSRQLREQIALLSNIRDSREQSAQIQTQQAMIDRIDLVLREKVEKINTLLLSIPDRFEGNEEEKNRSTLSHIKLLVNYCKRRAGLALQEMRDEPSDTTALSLWIQEALFEADAAGIKGIITEDHFSVLPMRISALLYDCFDDLLEKCAKLPYALLVVRVSGNEYTVSLQMAVEGFSNQKQEAFHLSTSLQNVLFFAKGDYNIEKEDDRAVISVVIKKGGVPFA